MPPQGGEDGQAAGRGCELGHGSGAAVASLSLSLSTLCSLPFAPAVDKLGRPVYIQHLGQVGGNSGSSMPRSTTSCQLLRQGRQQQCWHLPRGVMSACSRWCWCSLCLPHHAACPNPRAVCAACPCLPADQREGADGDHHGWVGFRERDVPGQLAMHSPPQAAQLLKLPLLDWLVGATMAWPC